MKRRSWTKRDIANQTGDPDEAHLNANKVWLFKSTRQLCWETGASYSTPAKSTSVVYPKQLICLEWKFLIICVTGEITVYFIICFLETLTSQPLLQICGYITHLYDDLHAMVTSSKLVSASWTKRQGQWKESCSQISFSDKWQKYVTWLIKNIFFSH